MIMGKKMLRLPASMRVANATLKRRLNEVTQGALKDSIRKNYEANSPILKAGKGLKEFDPPHPWQYKPAFLVAAGPSLNKNVAELKRVKGLFPILAVEAALRPMMEHGVKPDAIFAVDVKACQKRFWEGLDVDGITLLAVSCIHPEVIDSWPGAIRFYNTAGDKDVQELQLEVGKDFGSLPVGGNVSTLILSFARMFLHSNPAVFVGHDFSFPAGRYYAHGADHNLAAWGKHCFKCFDHYGKPAFTDMSLYAYSVWTLDMIRAFRNNFIKAGAEPPVYINSTEGGILGAYQLANGKRKSNFIRFQTLKETIDDCIAQCVGTAQTA